MNLFRMPVMRKLAICLLAVLMLSLLSVCSRSAVAVLHTHPIAPGSAKSVPMQAPGTLQTGANGPA
jgi:hypothetical protein